MASSASETLSQQVKASRSSTASTAPVASIGSTAHAEGRFVDSSSGRHYPGLTLHPILLPTSVVASHAKMFQGISYLTSRRLKQSLLLGRPTGHQQQQLQLFQRQTASSQELAKLRCRIFHFGASSSSICVDDRLLTSSVPTVQVPRYSVADSTFFNATAPRL
uniref:Uncharacterized protein n=1 Tax=Panagrellus redivivus TaxID=6233 RepID=A0A7E4ZVL5_PANRE